MSSRAAALRPRVRMSAADCPFAAELDATPWRAAVKDRALHALIPLARAPVRYGPGTAARRWFWTRWVEPYLAWHAHRFEARTIFGPRVTGTTLDILQQHLYYFGVWEPVLTRWMHARLRPGDGFVDVGANLGYFSLFASTRVGPDGTVVAIEASPTVYALLEDTVRRNRLANVRVINAAASDAAGTMPIFRGPDSHTGLSSLYEQEWLVADGEVRADTLGALLSPDELRRVRLIKIDVEGAENRVIDGLAGQLPLLRDDAEIVVEFHPGDRTPIMRTLEAAGFHPYRLDIDYSPLAYRELRQTPRARRVTEPVEGELDVIFSRLDAEML